MKKPKRSKGISLVPIHGLDHAEVCRTFFHGKETVFQFTDMYSSHVYGEYQIGNPVSRAPDGCLGAVLMKNGSWNWVVKEK